ncbi:uncharacterized protein LOC143578083 [Bidens hawaiensis]|uniref:uncharacterized protein LOC143578083 n=1 Tax=Bidens hawaiensis TaxID=980011 RepID=UPI00404B1EF7
MVKQANKKRLEKEFNVGDMVYLKLQQYRQKSVHDRKSNKLSKQFFGPYKVLERIGQVAYKLEMPSTSKIHPVFHISLLKQSHGNLTTSKDTLEEFLAEDNFEKYPEAVLDHRVNNHNTQQVLIKWTQQPLEEATWEDLQDMKEPFPHLPGIEDDASSEVGDDDTIQSGPATSQAQQQAAMEGRPKRETRKPIRFED